MGSVRVIPYLFTYLYIFSVVYVKADECITYNLEKDVEKSFVNNKDDICSGSKSLSIGYYSDIGVNRPHPHSSTFIYLTSDLSCGSSFDFSNTNGGTVEINVYFSGSATTDHIKVIFKEDVIGGSSFIRPSLANFVPGWQTLKFNVTSAGTSSGHVTIFGEASNESIILVDSFRFIPLGMDEDSCVIYKDYTESTLETTSTTDDLIVSTTQRLENTDATTQEVDNLTYSSTQRDEDISTTTSTTQFIDDTTQDSNDIEDCTTYNFESDFEVLFSTDNYLCNGFLSWQLDNYTSIGIESPYSQSTVFIAPHETTSCISSFVFKMEPGGVVEANVFMGSVQSLDHIIILAQRVTDAEYDTVAGVKMYHLENEVFVAGWNVIKFSLLDRTSFDGYLLFIGSADSNSTVLVDSIRYIPPLTPPEDSSCSFY